MDISIAYAQIDFTAGAVEQNYNNIKQAWQQASKMNADVLCLPEGVLHGYPCGDLAYKPAYMKKVHDYINEMILESVNYSTTLIVGSLFLGSPQDKLPYNSALVIAGGKLQHLVHKQDLPNYGVFDDKRRYKVSESNSVINIKGVNIGILICEDAWNDYVSADLKKQGANILLNINASPWDDKKVERRFQTITKRVQENDLPIIYINRVGGQDSLVFDGRSFVLDHKGSMISQAKSWESDIILTNWKLENNILLSTDEKKSVIQDKTDPNNSIEGEYYQAMMCGLSSYYNKNGFKNGVVLGLSGGIDSAITAAVAVDALGKENVHCILMPSPYTSQASLDDAQGCVDNLGVSFKSISIEPAMTAFNSMIGDALESEVQGITAENIQSRSRGLLLMGVSNATGKMLLTTGNKSEVAVGYATLYGDMCGGYSVLTDLYKTKVFNVCKWRNQHIPKNSLSNNPKAMPDSVISKPPSAELRPDQKDEDSLPPYEILDGILELLVENDYNIAECVNAGYELETVKHVRRLFKLAQYKRYQSAPGVVLTARPFIVSRRYPLTDGYWE